MKKTISIIVACAMFVASLATNIYYIFDGDTETVPNVEEVVSKGKDVYNAVKGGDDAVQDVGAQK